MKKQPDSQLVAEDRPESLEEVSKIVGEVRLSRGKEIRYSNELRKHFDSPDDWMKSDDW